MTWPLRLALRRLPRRLQQLQLLQHQHRHQQEQVQRLLIARRLFSQHARPQLPFLSEPAPRQQFRYMTTERKRWLKHEILGFTRLTSLLLGMSICGWVIYFALREEARERDYPTPHDWSYYTRYLVREALFERDNKDVLYTDHIRLFQLLRLAYQRLEDPAVDAGREGLPELARGADPPHPPGSRDVSGKSDEWRRGYYQVLLAAAKEAEHVDGFVVDRTRKMCFPADVVVGPSNPKPKPMPFGTHGAPREENCELAFPESADYLYQKLLGTRGLTRRERMGAALAYASWLEFKGCAAPAAILYEDAVMLALPGKEEEMQDAKTTSRKRPSSKPLDEKTWTLNQAAGPPSANLLTSLTAYASFRARQGDVSSALPMMISLLQARRSLPHPDSPAAAALARQASARYGGSTSEAERPHEGRSVTAQLTDTILSFIAPPPYPPPPPDGSLPPVRDPHQLCEEAALHMHIGEMLYSSSSSTRSRDDGLAWTREAVDLAEQQLHRIATIEEITGKRKSKDELSVRANAALYGADATKTKPAGATFNPAEARTRCRECLMAGLDNWATMVAQLAAKEEEEARKSKEAQQQSGGGGGGSSWFGLWGSGSADGNQPGRWAAEQKVVAEKQRRAKQLLEAPEAPPMGLMSLFRA